MFVDAMRTLAPMTIAGARICVHEATRVPPEGSASVGSALDRIRRPTVLTASSVAAHAWTCSRAAGLRQKHDLRFFRGSRRGLLVELHRRDDAILLEDLAVL